MKAIEMLRGLTHRTADVLRVLCEAPEGDGLTPLQIASSLAGGGDAAPFRPHTDYALARLRRDGWVTSEGWRQVGWRRIPATYRATPEARAWWAATKEILDGAA